jgi:hypothetical protein
VSRTRLIKPAFFKHAELFAAEKSSGLPLRVAFAGLWTVADREGRFRWKVDLKPDVLPYDEVDMLRVLAALEQHGFVRQYEVVGKQYGVIPSFSDHQTFHKTERKSEIPPPPTVDLPLDNGEPPVRYTAVTGTGTVTGTVQHPTGADAPVAKVAQRPRKPLAGEAPKYPHFSKASCDQLYDAWSKFGKPPYSSFRSAFGPLFGERPDHPLPDVLAAIREAISRAEREPYTASNLTPHSFVSRLGYWIGEAKGRLAVDPKTGIPLAVMR